MEVRREKRDVRGCKPEVSHLSFHVSREVRRER